MNVIRVIRSVRHDKSTCKMGYSINEHAWNKFEKLSNCTDGTNNVKKKKNQKIRADHGRGKRNNGVSRIIVD